MEPVGLMQYSQGLSNDLYSGRPRWSLGNVLASRSKVCGFKPGWGRWIFSGRKNPEYKSFGSDFKLRVPSLVDSQLSSRGWVDPIPDLIHI